MEPTEEQKQQIFDYVRDSEIDDIDQLISELEEKFSPDIVKWWSDSMLDLPQPQSRQEKGDAKSRDNR